MAAALASVWATAIELETEATQWAAVATAMAMASIVHAAAAATAWAAGAAFPAAEWAGGPRRVFSAWR